MRREHDGELFLFNEPPIEGFCHIFNFEPGSKSSDLFITIEAIDYLAKEGGSIRLVADLVLVTLRGRVYAEIFDGTNLASVVGALVEPNEYRMVCDCSWLQCDIGFWHQDGLIMVELIKGDKKGSFRYTDAEKFIELVEKFNDSVRCN